MFTNPLLGYRKWQVSRDGYLLSTGLGQITWRPGVNYAYCREHLAPNKNCECGLYASHTIHNPNFSRYIYGTVLARGQVEIHRDGFRAAEVQPLALLAPSGDMTEQEKVYAASSLYDLPVFQSEKELNDFSFQYGSLADLDMLPEDHIPTSIKTTTNEHNQIHSIGDMPAQKFIDEKGFVFKQLWYKNGRLHRDRDRPAMVVSSALESNNDKQCWYQNGKLHRDGDKPAAIYKDGVLEWYRNGQLHRKDGPAVIYPKNHPRCPSGRSYFYEFGVLSGTSDI